jgi:hypothetical protein
MVDLSKYRYQPGVSVVEEIDLDQTPVTVDGRPYTETDAAADAEQAARQYRAGLIPGGKSLSGDGSHSPTLRTVVSASTADAVRRAAADHHMSVSKWLRQLIERDLAA